MSRLGNLVFLSAACIASAIFAAQSSDIPDWQTAAGGKMSFEVASVKPSKVPKIPNFPLDNRNAKTAGGRFSASFGLMAYIGFAYKLSAHQMPEVAAQLPKWAIMQFFDIEALGAGNPTKDQVRLMMQSLLADRFKLAVHFETREGPVFALTLVKPAKIGPKLRPHAEGPPCPDSFKLTLPSPGAPPSAGEVFPPNCGSAASQSRNGVWLVGDRNTTMPLLADALYSYGFIAGEVDKPVVDKTGLVGTFDFVLEYLPGENNRFVPPGPPNPDAPPPDPQGTPFLNAVREQLGLKLASSKGPIQVLVIDHVEEPSEN